MTMPKGKLTINIRCQFCWLSALFGILICIIGIFLSDVAISEAKEGILKIKQWGMFEKAFSTNTYYSKSKKYTYVKLSAIFSNSVGKTYTVPGFWDGGSIWRIRFSPPSPGEWSYSILSADNDLDSHSNDGAFVAEPPTIQTISRNPNYRGFLKIGSNRRYFTYADGTPFFWMGGTIWRGNGRHMSFDQDPKNESFSGSEFRYYIDNRRSKGFTLIQLVVGHLRSSSGNEGGPIFEVPFSEINPAHFQWLDKRIQYIVDQGMIPLIMGQWEKDTDLVPLDRLKEYWTYLIARYQAYNVIWCISGEYGAVMDLTKLRRLGQHVHQIDPMKHLTTIHPTPNPPHKAYSSSKHFFGEVWIDFHLHQTWNYDATRLAAIRDYQRLPTIPFVNGEAGYDGLWKWTRDMVRKDAWTVYLSGGAGYTYGSHGIWTWNDGCCDSEMTPHPRWQTVINSESSLDMKRISDFFSQIEWWRMTPRDDLVSYGYVLADPGNTYLIYLPAQEGKLARILNWTKSMFGLTNFFVDLSFNSGPFDVLWFNPRTGETKNGERTLGGNKHYFTPPNGSDMVLYIVHTQQSLTVPH